MKWQSSTRRRSPVSTDRLGNCADNPNAGVDPEVIAPLSKLKDMMIDSSSAQHIQITLGGQLMAKGQDLVYVIGRENFKSGILGG